MSSFDPDQFVNTTVEEATATERLVVPGNKYNAQVDHIDIKHGTISKGDNAGKTWARLDVFWSIIDEGLKQEFGQDKIIRVQGIFLDLDDNNQLAGGKGKNVELGLLRKAVKQNEDGQPWSMNMLVGQLAQIDVAVGEYKGAPQNQIRGVAEYEG